MGRSNGPAASGTPKAHPRMEGSKVSPRVLDDELDVLHHADGRRLQVALQEEHLVDCLSRKEHFHLRAEFLSLRRNNKAGWWRKMNGEVAVCVRNNTGR